MFSIPQGVFSGITARIEKYYCAVRYIDTCGSGRYTSGIDITERIIHSFRYY
jgi:hypothetical protein